MSPSTTSTRKPTLDRVLEVLESLHGRPVYSERLEDPLIDHLLVGVLGTIVDADAARAGVRALSEAFLDFNEARSSPLSELEEVLAASIPEAQRREAAWAVRMALQDVWDGTHGLDLEPLRGREPEDQRSFLKDLPNIPGGPAALVFQLALGDKQLTFGPRERHLLSRFGFLPRAATPQKVRQAMERKIKATDRYRFTWLAGAASRAFEKDWDPKHPFCQLLVAVKAKEVVERERERKREELRQKAEEKRRQQEEARRLRDEEKAQKTREREEEKRRKAEAKKAAEAARKEEARKQAEAKKAEAARKKAEAKALAAKKQAEAKKQVEARKKAEAKKKADARKKTAPKGKAAAKTPARPAGASKKAAAPKKTSTASKKAAAAKKAAPAAKKPTTSKKASAKKATGGPAKAPSRRRTPARKK